MDFLTTDLQFENYVGKYVDVVVDGKHKKFYVEELTKNYSLTSLSLSSMLEFHSYTFDKLSTVQNCLSS